jgi:hypothetical protein
MTERLRAASLQNILITHPVYDKTGKSQNWRSYDEFSLTPSQQYGENAPEQAPGKICDRTKSDSSVLSPRLFMWRVQVRERRRTTQPREA